MRESGSDEALHRRFLNGETRAFDELMRRHEDRIFSLALRMTGDRSDALDATQETFLSAYRQAARFRGESAFGTWLYRIGMNACHDLLRKRRPTTDDVILAGMPETRGSAVEDVAAARIDVARALALIPNEYREAVVLHDLGTIPYEEIARITDTSIGTVKSRISRGRRRLAEIMEQPSAPSTSKDMR